MSTSFIVWLLPSSQCDRTQGIPLPRQKSVAKAVPDNALATLMQRSPQREKRLTRSSASWKTRGVTPGNAAYMSAPRHFAQLRFSCADWPSPDMTPKETDGRFCGDKTHLGPWGCVCGPRVEASHRCDGVGECPERDRRSAPTGSMKASGEPQGRNGAGETR